MPAGSVGGMRPRILLVILTVADPFIAGCGSSPTGSKANSSTTSSPPKSSKSLESQSAQQIVAAAVAATEHESSFHFVEVAGTAQSSVRIVGDVGSSSGEQHISVIQGTQKGNVTVLLTNGTAYFTGDVLGLEGFTGVSKTAATPLVGKWISVPSTNVNFASITASLEVKTAAGVLVKLSGTLKRGRVSTELGHRAVSVKAAEKSSSGKSRLDDVRRDQWRGTANFVSKARRRRQEAPRDRSRRLSAVGARQ